MHDLALLGVAVNGPGIPNWARARAGFRSGAFQALPIEDAPTSRMNSRDRRRASDTVRLAVEIGFEAAECAGLPPGDLPAVFASCHGEGAATHKLLLALAEPNPFVSPTLFHNSVHNTPAGYWSITAGTRVSTTSISAGRVTFATALMKAALIVELEATPALMVAYDAPFPDPLSRLCPFPGPLGVGLVLAPGDVPGAMSRLSLSFEQPSARACTDVTDPEFGLLFEANPIGQCIPLLEAVAREADEQIVLDIGAGARIVVRVRSDESHSN